MSVAVVVDASVAVKWLVKEEDVADALRLLEGAEEIHAPKLLLGEVANAVWKHVRRRDITANLAATAIDALPGYINRLIDTENFLREAFEMACFHDHPVYDCIYLATARHFGLPLVTADLRLLRKFAGTPYATSILPLSHWRP